MTGKFWISFAVIFVLSFAMSWGVHGGLLHGDYQTLMSWMRKPDEANALMPWMLLAHVVFCLGFVWVYLQGREDRPWLAQGIRYGIAIACLAIIPVYLMYHVVTPVPLGIAVKQIIFDAIRVVLLGIAVAWLNRGATTRHA
jgi:hypothetical protein